MPQAIPIIGAGLIGGLGTAAAGSVAAGALTLGVVGSTALTFSVGSALAATALSALGTGLSMLTAGQADRRRGSAQFVTSRSSIAPQWHILGRARVGGSMVHFESTDTEPSEPQFGDDRFMNYVIPMANNRCRQLRELYLEDQRVAYFPGGDGDTVPANSDLTRDTETDYGKRDDIVGYMWRRGDDDQPVAQQIVDRGNWRFGDPTSPDYDLAKYDELVAQGEPVWLPSATGNGVAYVGGLLGWDTQFEVLKGQIPPTTAVWDGDVEVYDPRDGQYKFTRNPALNIRRFLELVGWQDDELDDASFAAEANICDETMTLADGSTEPRYTCDIAFAWDTLRPRDMLRDMLTSCGGQLVYANGTLSLMTAAWRPPALSFDDGDLRAGFAIRTGQPLQQTFNSVSGTYREPEDLYQPAPYDTRDSATYLAQDGELLEAVLDFPCTTSKTTAGRLALIELNRSRQQINATIPYTLVALDVGVGDTISHSSPENGWEEKAFEVTSITPVFGENTGLLVGFDVSVVETTAAIYDRVAAGEDPAVVIRKTTLNLPLDAPGPVTAVMQARQNPDGASVLGIDVSWPPVLRAAVDGYDVFWRDIDDGPDGVWQTAPVVETRHFISPVEAGLTYEIEVLARTKSGRLSDRSETVTVLAAGDETAPAAPFSLTTAGEFRSIRVRWFNPSDADYEKTEIWSNGSDDRDQASLLDTIAGTSLIDSGHNPGASRWYWARAIDYSGNVGEWNALAGTKGTASALTEHDILENQIKATQLAASLQTSIARIEPIDVDIEEIRGRITPIEEDVESIGERITPIEEDVESIGERITPIEENIESIGERIDPIEEDVGSIAARITPIEIDLATLDTARALFEARQASELIQVAGAQSELARTVQRALASIDQTRDTLRQAEIVVDPATGQVRLFALDRVVEQFTTQLTEAQVTVDGVTGRIESFATRTYVEGLVADAVFDPSDIGIFDDLQIRVTTAESTLDGALSQIIDKASQVDFDGVTGRVSTAESRLDGIDGVLTQKASVADLDAQGGRLTTAEQEISAIDGGAIRQAVRDVSFLHEGLGSLTRAVLTGTLAQDEAHAAQRVALAEASREIRANQDGLVAEAAERLELAAVVAEAAAAIEVERTARADGISAEASARSILAARMGEAESAIVDEASANVARHNAQAERLSGLDVAVGDNAASLTEIITLDVTSETALVTAVRDVVVVAGDAKAALEEITTLDVNSQTALVKKVNNTSAALGDNLAAIGGITKLRADNDGKTLAQIVSDVTVVAGDTAGYIGDAQTLTADGATTIAELVADVVVVAGNAKAAIGDLTTLEVGLGSSLVEVATNLNGSIDGVAGEVSDIKTVNLGANTHFATTMSAVLLAKNNAAASITALETVNLTANTAFAETMNEVIVAKDDAAAAITNLETVNLDADTHFATTMSAVLVSRGKAAASITAIETVDLTADTAFAETMTDVIATTGASAAAITAIQTLDVTDTSAFGQTIRDIVAAKDDVAGRIEKIETVNLDEDTHFATTMSNVLLANATAATAITAIQTVNLDADTAFAETMTEVLAAKEDAAGAITAIQTLDVTSDTVLAETMRDVVAAKGDAAAAITALETVNLDADTHFATTMGAVIVAKNEAAASITALETVNLGADTAFAQTMSDVIAAKDDAAAAITRIETLDVTSETALATTMRNVVATAGAAKAAIGDLTTLDVSETQTLVEAVNTTSAVLGDNIAAIGAIRSLSVDGNQTLAQVVGTVQTATGDNTSSIQTAQTSINGLSAEYTLKLDVNGLIAGFGLSIENNASGARTSNAIFNVNNFAVGDSTGNRYPFIVSGGQVFIRDAIIQDAAITRVKIGVAEIDTLRIAGNAATVVKTKLDHVTRTGNGSWTKIGTTTLHLDTTAQVIVWLVAGQGFAAFPAEWAFQIRVNGAVIASAVGTDPGDTVTIIGGGSYGAGVHTIEAWSKADADINIFGSRLVLMVSKR